MGTGGSLPNNFKSQEPPPLPPPFYTGNPSRISGISCGPEPDRRASGASTVTLGSPGFQHPRCSSSMKNEEWWHHRPSAQSLSGLRPQQETLLTYAGQMTGWQSSCESGMPSMHQEAMELSRTVSHLAAANQQLASAHTTLLGQLESLYLELNRERELRLERDREDGRARIPSSSSVYENEREKLTNRVANLEATMGERTIIREANLRERKSRKSHDESSKSFSTRNIGIQSEDSNDQLEVRLRSPSLEINKTALFSENQRFGNESHYHFPSSTNDEKYEKSHIDNDLSLEYKKAVERIESLENELTTACVDSVRQIGARENTRSKRMNENQGSVKESKNIDQKRKYEVIDSNYEKDFTELLQEIEGLRNDKLDYRSRNEKLMGDLKDREILVESLKTDCENSRLQSEKLESSLTEQKKQFDALIKEYESAILEKTKLSKDLQVFNFERDTANLRIADLEKELTKLTEEKERMSKIENQESSRLKKILSEEMRNRKEQAKALEEALMEIQRLNGVIENGEKSGEARAEAAEVIQTEIESSPEDEEEEEISDPEIAVARKSNMEEFRKELSLKREARQRAIAAVSSEMDRLRRELDAEKEAHSETSRVLDLLKSGQATNAMTKQDVIDEDIRTVTNEDLHDNNDWRKIMKADPELDNNEADAQALTDILKISDELKSSIRLQTEKIDDLRYHLECETENHQNRIANLKEVAKASRELSSIREHQTNKLKNLLAQILTRLGDPRFRVDIQDDVRSEHNRQIEDIRRLKTLYDDRLRILVDLRETATKELKDVKEKLKCSWKENRGLEEDLKKAEEKIDRQDTEISNLESQLGLTKADCRDLQNQMSVINGLFTQMLLSASSADMDLDRLTRLLQENHDLISDMAREEGTEAAALPKLLLDIVEQVEGRGGAKSGEGENDKKDEDRQEENIAHNLPKVWRVLLELLSCHAAVSSPVTPASLSTDPNSCYKSVDTPSGPRLVISVSKTYIRLKELILEKKHLEKEMNRMKTLNTHLESKLGEQEKRLSTVSSELNKTWNIVGRMQAQHQQLHTHEKILRYELQQKRKMLQELKQELEYCREKWESARQKNTNTEIEWRSLRREFAARKSLVAQDSFNNSAESGFSDERGDDSDEEDEALGERVRLGPRRRARKDNPRAPTPDTESEQPTDTELSESKTTPETNVSTEDVSIAGTSANSTDKLANEESEVPIEPKELVTSEDDVERHKPINKLDQALTNVIQNLIIVDRSNGNSSRISISSSDNEDGATVPSTSTAEPEVQEKRDSRHCEGNYEEIVLRNNKTTDPSEFLNIPITDTPTDVVEEPSTSTISVFSIGPFPSSVSPPSAKSVQFSDPLIVGPSIQTALPLFGDAVPEIKNLTETTMVDGKACSPINGESVEKAAVKNGIIGGPGNSEELSGSSHKELPEVVTCNALKNEKIDQSCEPAKSSIEEQHIEEENIKDRVEDFSSNCEESTESKDEKLPEIVTCNSSAIEEIGLNCDTTSSTSEEQIKNGKDENCVASLSGSRENSAGSTQKELSEVVSSSVNVSTVSLPSTSETLPQSSSKPVRSHEEVLAARAARLRRLEEQADWLMKKMNATSRRGSALCNRLEELHEVYGEAPVPPPMPDVLPTVRIPLEMRDRQKEDDTRKKGPNEKPPPGSP